MIFKLSIHVPMSIFFSQILRKLGQASLKTSSFNIFYIENSEEGKKLSKFILQCRVHKIVKYSFVTDEIVK